MGMFDNFRRRMSKSGGSIRNERIIATRHFYNSAWEDDISCRTVSINGKDAVVRIYDLNSKNKRTNVKNITRIDGHSFNYGDEIVFKMRRWLVVERDDTQSEILCTGIMQECNYLLRWIDSGGILRECWSIAGDGTKYSTGESDRSYVTVGNTRMELLLSQKPETLMLQRDMRIIVSNNPLSPNVYKITKLNNVDIGSEAGGIVSIICVEDEFNEQTDSRELLIADFINESTIRLLTPESIELASGKPFQIQAAATFKGAAVPSPQLRYKSLDEAVCTIDESGRITAAGSGAAKVSVSYLGAEAVMNVLVSDDAPDRDYCRISCSPTIGIGGEKLLSARFFNASGEESPEPVVWRAADYHGKPMETVCITPQELNTALLSCTGAFDAVGQKAVITAAGEISGANDSVTIEIIAD